MLTVEHTATEELCAIVTTVLQIRNHSEIKIAYLEKGGGAVALVIADRSTILLLALLFLKLKVVSLIGSDKGLRIY